MRWIQLALFLAAGSLFSIAGCKQDMSAPGAGGGGGGPPAVKVTVAKPIVRDVTQWDEYTGRLKAVESVQLNARVSGFVQSVSFTDGALVKKGDVL